MPSADRLLSDRGLQSEAWLHTYAAVVRCLAPFKAPLTALKLHPCESSWDQELRDGAPSSVHALGRVLPSLETAFALWPCRSPPPSRSPLPSLPQFSC